MDSLTSKGTTSQKPKADPFFLDAETRIYAVWQKKPLLAGMPYPASPSIWEDLSSLGFDSVVCLTDDEPGYNPSPLRLLKAIPLQDLCGNRHPGNPSQEQQRIVEIVEGIVSELNNNRSVVVHCEGGTGRTGTVLACVMRELGMPIEDVLAAMTRINELRGRSSDGWPESEWQRAVVVGW